MYARVVTGQYQPGKLEEGFQMYRDSIVPATMKTQGFKGALGLADRSTGKVIAITLRKTKADMQAICRAVFFKSSLPKLCISLRELPR